MQSCFEHSTVRFQRPCRFPTGWLADLICPKENAMIPHSAPTRPEAPLAELLPDEVRLQSVQGDHPTPQKLPSHELPSEPVYVSHVKPDPHEEKAEEPQEHPKG
jgi:hypothetical protein